MNTDGRCEPQGNGYPDRVKKAYDAGAITRDEIETSVKRILGLILKLD